MHDIDRTQTEAEWESDFGQEYGFSPEIYGETFGEFEFGFEGPLNEADEMELAAELLSVGNEAELDQFLGSLFRKVGKSVGKLARGPIGKALGGVLKTVASKALPVVGGALGSFVAPGIGTAIGSSLGSAAGRMFGLELEGMSAEDQEYEVARRFVRFAGEAIRQASDAPASAPAQQVVQSALTNAAQQHAPGLVPPSQAAVPFRGGRTGRWIRQGRQIILLGV